MPDQHARSAHVLHPAYVADLDVRSVEELRGMREECLELETEVSYVRRVAQARIDIVEAELERRSTGGSVEDLIRALPQILADTGPRADPASSRLPLLLAPREESEWTPQLEEFEGLLANLPAVSDDGLHDAITRMRAFEREVSDQRRALHDVMDRIDLGLADRLKAGTA